MSEPGTDDASLVEAFALGDVAAARELYRRHCQSILRFAVSMTGSRTAAEDIVHDTFVELLNRPRNYDPSRGSLRAFLYGIARHRVAKSLRGAVRVPYSGLSLDEQAQRPLCEPSEQAAETHSPQEQAEHAQDVEHLRASLMTLPLEYREVIAWCDLEEVPYATVADILDCPIGTVRSRLHRARARLAAAFQPPRRQSAGGCRPESGTGSSEESGCTSRGGVLGGESA